VNGVATSKKLAKKFFATYLDADSGEQVCSFKRNADACYSRVLNVKCDPSRNVAEINIYTIHKSFKWDIERNPKIGSRCSGKDNVLFKRGKIVKVAIPCDLENVTICKECSDSTYCPERFYDSLYEMYDRYCIPYRKIGEVCESRFYFQRTLGLDLIGTGLCNPKESYCGYQPSWCKEPLTTLVDHQSTCVEKGVDCRSDIDCDKSTEYCYFSTQCRPRHKDGECCHVKTNWFPNGDFWNPAVESCIGDSKCLPIQSSQLIDRGFLAPPAPQIVCRPPCTKDSECVPTLEVCGPPDRTSGLRYCECEKSQCEKVKLAILRWEDEHPQN